MILRNSKHLLALFTLLLPFSSSYAVDKHANDVFKKWMSWQQVVQDQNLEVTKSPLDANLFKVRYLNNIPLLKNQLSFLNSLTANQIVDDGCEFNDSLKTALASNIAQMYTLIEHDIPGFITFLKNHNVTKGYNINDDVNANNTIEQYTMLISMLCANPDQATEHAKLFAIANRFFEFCFHPETWPYLRSMMLDKKEYPIARFFYAVIWHTLAGNGWKHWHEESLKGLKQQADLGKRIIYIAGGSDIYQMLKAGIYNITIIDPQLPTQPKYYTEGWDWILCGQGVNGGLGDHLYFTVNNKQIVMKRTGFTRLNSAFQAYLSTNETITIQNSKTEWSIFEDGNFKGTYVLERRFCEQSDFVAKPDQTLLMSFNELHFIAAPATMGGWGIDVAQIPNNFELIVKQLRKSVTKATLGNMRFANLLNGSDFKYISLGTCIN